WTICVSSRSSLFPYTTLFRSLRRVVRNLVGLVGDRVHSHWCDLLPSHHGHCGVCMVAQAAAWTKPDEPMGARRGGRRGIRNPFSDRKSTRLNSSHVKISYAVF